MLLEWLLLLVLAEGMIDHHIIDDTSISTGIEHTCAVHLLSEADFGGQVLCWGSNGQGQSSPPKVWKESYRLYVWFIMNGNREHLFKSVLVDFILVGSKKTRQSNVGADEAQERLPKVCLIKSVQGIIIHVEF